MKRTVLTFGLIAGAILSAMMLLTIPFQDEIGFERGAVIGYTTMVLAFLMIFFGIRSYRDNVAGGTIRIVTGTAAFSSGCRAASSSKALCYVATWQVVYYKLAPDFMAKYQAHVLEKARADGESMEALAKRQADMDRFAELYRNPAFNIGGTFLEPMPVAVLVVLVSAGVLSRRNTGASTANPGSAASGTG